MKKLSLTGIAALFLATGAASIADAQGIYMLNGRATPSVIVGGDGERFPSSGGSASLDHRRS